MASQGRATQGRTLVLRNKCQAKYMMMLRSERAALSIGYLVHASRDILSGGRAAQFAGNFFGWTALDSDLIALRSHLTGEPIVGSLHCAELFEVKVFSGDDRIDACKRT